MEDTAKYLIHATIAADGVVERSDVVGAVFGQTEGLLGDELDLRDLQQSDKVGRIDVAIESENGQSFGELTVASSLEKVETAILGAALETITRIGPCEASVEVTSIEDVRAAKRREVVDRAKELLASGFEETSLSSDDVLDEVREAARVEGVTEYEGLPAGPRVGDSDAVIVVEGRADVSTLLDAGIKNAVAVEGTNVPDAVADLTADRTVTAFLDGDRGGELILRELGQVGDVDYAAFAPAGRSVEDLDRGEVLEALRAKVPYATVADEPNLREAAVEADDGGSAADGSDAGATEERGDGASADDQHATHDADERTDDDRRAEERDADARRAEGSAASDSEATESGATEGGATEGGATEGGATESDAVEPDATEREKERSTSGESESTETPAPTATESAEDDGARSFEEHVQEVVDSGSGRVRLLDADGGVLAEADAEDAFDAVADAAEPPHTVVLDGTVNQRLLDVAAQRGVSELFGTATGDFVKKPVGTRVRTSGDLRAEAA
ncbi:DNA primase DnaG [Haloparvum sedimenti]|uniref:DNA primase DnaG n=1 Tax=Haloparvum sedimenti TaxID=1678448 RepID=UPI00071E6D25|nr:DNA primase DnaG [Haloparvum sedimenti]